MRDPKKIYDEEPIKEAGASLGRPTSLARSRIIIVIIRRDQTVVGFKENARRSDRPGGRAKK